MITDDLPNKKSIAKQLKTINFVQTFFEGWPSAKSKNASMENLRSHWKNNAMAATKHANCARGHRPEPMDLISKDRNLKYMQS